MSEDETDAGSRAAAVNRKARFVPEDLDSAIIAAPLLRAMQAPNITADTAHRVIIDLNLLHPGGRVMAKEVVEHWAEELEPGSVDALKGQFSDQYVFAKLTTANIKRLVQRDVEDAALRTETLRAEGRSGRGHGAIHRIWTDEKLEFLTNKTVSTVKADAARNAFAAYGEEIVWAVADTGIDRDHPHFTKYANLKLVEPLRHRDFTISSGLTPVECEQAAVRATKDEGGHGTHVAGIIAGEFDAEGPEEEAGEPDRPKRRTIAASARRRNADGEIEYDKLEIKRISGMSPRTKLMSLKVLNADGEGHASNLIAAIQYLQHVNGYGRHISVHGLNLSVGYEFDPEWFACGQSPLCVEVNRLVRSGVVVVVAAGNTGYGYVEAKNESGAKAGLDLTINDPGNADLAITVGSTHRDMPHIYGVSYFSSKGPTGDGRLKPDLVAPGEKVISCMSADDPENSRLRGPTLGQSPNSSEPVLEAQYKESSGTSMAAPHVSGVIAAFLSIRREFIGRPESVKQLFLDSATDLNRDRHFQGRGLVDLMRALQSV